jgi:MFS family permease
MKPIGQAIDIAEDIPLGVSRDGMRAAVISACYKAFTAMSFTNGLVLVYLSAMKLDGTTVLNLLSVVNVLMAISLIPCAHLADCYGKRRVTFVGIFLCGLGFALLPMIGFFPDIMVTGVVALGIGLFGIGHGAQMAAWFAILHPLVPSHYRGRFFGILRVAWQLCVVVSGLLIAFVLPRETSLPLLKMIMVLTGLTVIPWAWYSYKIPEVEREQCDIRELAGPLKIIARAPGYLPFCAYVFIINLFVGGCPAIFGLIEKRILALPDGTVIFLANMTLLGGVLGFYVGGKVVDRIGAKLLFLFCHFGYGIILTLFVVRDLLPIPLFPLLIVIHFLFGVLTACSSISYSTEMMALIPPIRKSITTSFCSTMIHGGSALSGLLSASAISMGLLAASWPLCGVSRSAYDAVLVFCAALIVLMSVTLGLIPSVVGQPKSESSPL